MSSDPGTAGGEFRPDPATVERLEPLLRLLASSPVSLSSVTDPAAARSVHVADSLSGLVLPEIRAAENVLDLGTGAGFPGLPLAVSLPEARFTLIDSVGRKVEFLRESIEALELQNAVAIKTRSEDLARESGREAFELVTARAVAPLDALAELASPLLSRGGSLVAWKGEREPDGEAALARISDRVAMALERVVAVRPYPSSRERHLYVVRKTGPTPANLPRRAGMARKRPLAASG